MTNEIKGTLESVNRPFASGMWSINIKTQHGGVRVFHGNVRMVCRFLEDERISLGEPVIVVMDEYGTMTHIRRAEEAKKK